MRISPRRAVYVLVGLVTFSGTVAVGYFGLVPIPEVSIAWTYARRGRYVSGARSEDGRELAMIYVGSSTCRWSNVDFLPDVIERLKLVVQRNAEMSGRSFAAIGISKDNLVQSGLRYIGRFGEFDEVMTGRGWLNIGILKYIHTEIPGTPATPQVLVVDRVVRRGSRGTAITDERLIARKVGADEIRRWLEQGAPMRQLRASVAVPANGNM